MHPSDHERLADQFWTLHAAVGGTWLTVVGFGVASVLYGVVFDVVGGACVLLGSAVVLLSLVSFLGDA